MPLDRREIRRALLQKGFRQAPGAHEVFYLHVEGRKTSIRTMLSRGSAYRAIDDSLVARIARELFLKRKQLVLLTSCKIDGAAYLGILAAQDIDVS